MKIMRYSVWQPSGWSPWWNAGTCWQRGRAALDYKMQSWWFAHHRERNTGRQNYFWGRFLWGIGGEGDRMMNKISSQRGVHMPCLQNMSTVVEFRRLSIWWPVFLFSDITCTLKSTFFKINRIKKNKRQCPDWNLKFNKLKFDRQHSDTATTFSSFSSNRNHNLIYVFKPTYLLKEQKLLQKWAEEE